MGKKLYASFLSALHQSFDLKSGYHTFLKSLFAAFFVLCSVGVWGQTTIFSENIGTGTATTIGAYTGWQNTTPITFSSTGTQSDVRNTTVSTGYTGSSGSSNVYLGTATTNVRDFLISGINTAGYSSLVLSFGLLRDTTTSGITLEVSSDGTTFTPLTIMQPAAANTWTLVTASGAIPSTSNLRIRFSKNTGTSFRIDDIKLTGTPSAPCSGTPTGGTVTVNPTSGAPATTYGVTATGYSTGSGLTYQWQYSDTGSAPWTNQGTATTSYAALAGLTVPAFTVRTWKLVVTCTNSAISADSTTGTFTSTYCKPTSSSPSTYITNFTTTGGAANINKGSGFSAGGYADYFSTDAVSIAAGSAFGGSITMVGTTVGIAIYVDYNNNQIFDASEKIYSTSAYQGVDNTPFPLNGIAAVPLATPAGDYRMRVIIDFNNSTPTACGFTSGRGEIEDYKLTVTAAASCTTPNPPTVATNSVTATSLNVAITPPTTFAPTGGYLVVRSLSSTPPTLTNGTAYAGDATYAVVSNGATTTVAQTGLTSNTKYFYYVYSQNTGCSGAPYYSAAAQTNVTTCAAAPTGLSVGTITSTGANFTWSSPTGGNAVTTITSTLNIYSNATYSTLVTTVSNVSSVYTLSTLSPSTTYWYQVVNSNGCGSSTNGSGSFTTLCAAVTSFPFNETFASYLPNCWLEGDAGTNLVTGPATTGGLAISDWVSDDYLNSTSPINLSAKMNIDAANGAEWLITPQIAVPATGTYRVKYNVGATQWNTSNALTTAWESDDFVELLISTTGTTNWTVLKTYNNANIPSHLGQLDEVLLSAYSGQTVRFAFRAFEGASNGSADIDFFVDNFLVEAAPTDAVDYANIQSPGVSTTTTGTSVDIYGQAYEPGVTEAAGAGAGLAVWYSKNATDVDPSSAAWTGIWTAATYNGQGSGANINNDEWKGTITPIPGQADTYYSFRYQLNGGPMRYGGYSATGGNFWDGTNNKNGKLSVNYDVYTTAVAPNNTVNNTIDVYFKDYDGITNFYTSGETEIWMYAGAHVGATTFNYTGSQNFADRATLVKFVRQTDPTIYKATLKFADILCVPNATDVITGIDLNFQNQHYTSGGVGSNNQTADLFLDLGDATVLVNAPTLAATTPITTTTATINWTAPTTGLVKGYDYYYSTSNTAPTAGTVPSGSTAVGVTTANLSSLSVGTPYYFWVRTKGCSPAVSAWSTMGTFTTTNIPTTYTWNGSTSNSWDVAANWTKSGGGNGVPTSIDSVIITGTGVPNKLSIAANKTVTNFELAGSDATSFTITGTNTLTITGTVAYTGTASATLSCASTVKISNASNQPIPPLTYGNLNAMGGNRTFSPAGIIKICNAFTVDPTMYTYTVTGSTVEYISSSSGWLMIPFTYNNLTFSGSGDFSLDVGTINVGGNFVQSNGTFYLGYYDDATLNVTGNMTLGNGVISSRDAFDSLVNVGGDLNIINGGRLLSYSNYGTDTVTVNGNVQMTGTGSWDNWSDSGSVVSIGGNLSLLDDSKYDVFYNSTITVGGNMTLNNNSYFNVENGGSGGNISITVNGDLSQSGSNIFYLNDDVTSILNVNGNMILNGLVFDLNYTSGGSGTVNLKGNLSVGSTSRLRAGHTNNATFNFTQTNGTVQNVNIQSPVAAVDFNVGSQANAKLLNNLQITGNASLTINGIFDADDKIVTGDTNPNQTLTIGGTGKFKTANTSGFSGGTATSVVTTPSPLDINVINQIAGSTVEYNKVGDQTVTNQVFGTAPNQYSYQNILISGSGDKTAAAGNLTVNNITKVDGGKLIIPETADTAMPNVFTSKKGVQVGASGTLVLANNANLMQDADAVNSGSIIAQRIAKLKFESVQTRADYNYWSSPVKDQKLLYNSGTAGISFSPGTPNNRIFQYKESNDMFVATTDAAFVDGKGYAIRAENAQNGSTYTADGTPKTFEFKGEPNNGNINTPNLLWTDAAHGYNLIGNPYPSNFDFDAFWLANKDNIYSTAYFWTNNQYTPVQQGSGYSGNNYAIYNGTGGNPATYQVASGSPVVPKASIKPGQGFIVQTKKAGALQFNNTMRDVAVSPFFNNRAAAKNRFWITLSTPAQIVNTILIGYIEGATDGFEKDFDTPLMVEGSDAFYSRLGTEKLGIQGKNVTFDVNEVIPLGTKHFAGGLHTIALQQKEGLFENQNVYLKDKLLNTVVNLSENPYQFSATPGVYENRFEIVYKPEVVLATDDHVKDNLQVYREGENFMVKLSKNKIGYVEVYDSSGKLIRNLKGGSAKVIIDGTTLSSGMYLLKIMLTDGPVTRKVIK